MLSRGERRNSLARDVFHGQRGQLREIVEESRARSAVYDIITNRVPVTIEVDTP